MSTPIYQSDSHDIFNVKNIQSANKGLIFERLFNQYTIADNSASVADEAKKCFLNNICNQSSQSMQYDTCAKRQLSLVKSIGGDAAIYTLEGHLVTGMGNSHPVENGFLWHYTLGVPYLCGSQVKGLVRATIEQYLDAQESEKNDVLYQWFGSDHKDPSKQQQDSQAGELIFFDALPYTKPRLTVDIMTPHMGRWYANGCKISGEPQATRHEVIPADWHNPTPIPFLAVDYAQFFFSIGKRPGSDIDIAEVFEVLDHALSYIGAGAKTQTGYGFMSRNNKEMEDLQKTIQDEQEHKQQQQAFSSALSNASPRYAQLLQTIKDEEWETKSNHFDTAIQEWLKILQAEPDAECAAQLLDIAKIHYVKKIKKPNHKTVKPHQREWIVALLALNGITLPQ